MKGYENKIGKYSNHKEILEGMTKDYEIKVNKMSTKLSTEVEILSN